MLGEIACAAVWWVGRSLLVVVVAVSVIRFGGDGVVTDVSI